VLILGALATGLTVLRPARNRAEVAEIREPVELPVAA
jgi:hypothetical protein